MRHGYGAGGDAFDLLRWVRGEVDTRVAQTQQAGSKLACGIKVGIGLLLAIAILLSMQGYKHRKQLGAYAKTAGRMAISAAV